MAISLCFVFECAYYYAHYDGGCENKIMYEMIQNFHFLRPLWLLALPLLLAIVYWAWRIHGKSSAWKNIIDAILLPSLQLENASGGGKLGFLTLITVIWIIACLALAGPSWQKVSDNAYRAPASWIILLDLSTSMTSTDLKPSRSIRARYAINDILDSAGENKLGLVIFSDEAYTVVPLTDDVANVRQMLESLTPDIMPSQGDELTPALERGRDLLQASSAKTKQMILLTDGFIDSANAIKMAKNIQSQGVLLNVVGIGAQYSNGASNDKLDSDLLKMVANAGGGKYYSLAQLPSLLDKLKAQSSQNTTITIEKNVKLETWLDNGVLLLPLLVLLAAFLGRRGWL